MRYTLSLFLLLFFASCNTAPSEPPLSSSDGGVIKGRVAIQSMSLTMDSSASNVAVKLVGRGIETITDDSGRWELTGVPLGAYTIEFSHDGYVSSEKRNFQFVGADTVDIGKTNLGLKLPELTTSYSSIVVNEDYRVDSFGLSTSVRALELQFSNSWSIPVNPKVWSYSIVFSRSSGERSYYGVISDTTTSAAFIIDGLPVNNPGNVLESFRGDTVYFRVRAATEGGYIEATSEMQKVYIPH